MFLFRKNIILVPTNYDGISVAKGLLSFDAYSGKTICTLHCYNLDIDKPLLLGIAIKNRLFKVKIEPQNVKSINFDLDVDLKNFDAISAVLLDVKQSDYDIVLWGSTEINNNWQTEIELMLEKEKIIPSNGASEVVEVNKTHEQNGDSYSTEFIPQAINETENITGDEVLEQFIDKVIELDEHAETQIAPQGENETEVKNDKSESIEQSDFVNEPGFYARLSPQIDKMFEENEPEQILAEIIPGGKFCKVDFDDGTGYYVFGVIYENSSPRYLCYGLPSKKDGNPPKEFSGLYQWLPIDPLNEHGDGFYMMYQDANTGENITVEVI